MTNDEATMKAAIEIFVSKKDVQRKKREHSQAKIDDRVVIVWADNINIIIPKNIAIEVAKLLCFRGFAKGEYRLQFQPENANSSAAGFAPIGLNIENMTVEFSYNLQGQSGQLFWHFHNEERFYQAAVLLRLGEKLREAGIEPPDAPYEKAIVPWQYWREDKKRNFLIKLRRYAEKNAERIEGRVFMTSAKLNVAIATLLQINNPPMKKVFQAITRPLSDKLLIWDEEQKGWFFSEPESIGIHEHDNILIAFLAMSPEELEQALYGVLEQAEQGTAARKEMDRLIDENRRLEDLKRANQLRIAVCARQVADTTKAVELQGIISKVFDRKGDNHDEMV